MDCKEAEKLAKQLMKKHGLSDWSFKFNNAKRRFGMCNPGRGMITLSAPITKLNNKEEVKNTILHEIAHGLACYKHGIWIQPHGREWKRIAKEIGCTADRCHNANVPDPKFMGVCPNCGKETKAYRRRRVACGVCCRKYNNGHYSSKFLIEWRKIKEKAI